jgi:ketosteroid isomerase-like protein
MLTGDILGKVCGLVAVCLLAAAPARSAGATEKDVLAAMDGWRQATMKKDKALFEKVYHPDLSYGHSSGLVETKAQAIEHVVSNSVAYEGIDLSESKVRVFGNTALLNGKLEMRQRATDGKLNVVNLVYLTVWLKSGRNWQMVARQATRPVPPAPAAAAAPASPAPAGGLTPAGQKEPAPGAKK